MNEPQQIRETVSQAYAGAVSSPKADSYCSPVQKGTLAKLAGYTREELDALPAEAVVNSFGCGNPLAYSALKEGEVVLDLGSGAGIDLLLAAKKVGPCGRAIGVDMTDEMIAKARETIAASGLDNIETRKGLIEDLPVRSSTVDWVISNCVINLSPEKENVFAEIARVLKPGGQMLVSDVVARDLPEQARNDLELYCSCIAGAISEVEYCDGLRRVGLVDIEIRERIEYDITQLQGLVESDLKVYEGAGVCCPGRTDGLPSPGQLAVACEGKVWSAKIYARKPD
jgi:SAM-dependent methyltransferase